MPIDSKADFRALMRPVRRLALRLLDLELWCIGRDVLHRENLLLGYGFTRRRPPANTNGGSEYALRLPNEGCLTLWGCGVHLAHPSEHGLWLKRYGFTPRCTPPGFVPAQYWHQGAWKRVPPPRTPAEWLESSTRLAELTGWFANYEQWVIEQAGLPYRESTLGHWHKKAVVPARDIVPSWEKLAEHFSSASQA